MAFWPASARKRVAMPATIFVGLVRAGSPTVLAEKGDRFSSRDEVFLTINEILSSDERLPMPIQVVRDALTEHYVDGDGRLFWVGSPRMGQLIERLRNAEDDGLFSRDYPEEYLVSLQEELKAGNAFTEAYAELAFSAFFLRYASDLKIGRFVPRRIDPELYVSRKKIDEGQALESLRNARDLDALFASWQPQSAEYHSLRRALGKYRAIAKNGRWRQIETGESLKLGMRDERVRQVRERLMAEGEITRSGANSDLYDEALEIAVRSFQSRHGLAPDGIIGKKTIFTMNVPADERVRQIIVNMERWRWMPEDLGDKHILVNIASFQLRRMEYGSMVEQIRVVVGKPEHNKPVFSNKIKYLEFNPTWTVPYSIATTEMLPKLQKNAAALGKTYELLRNGKPVSFHTIDWQKVSRRKFPFTIRQKSGPKNALGRVKFIFPNRHNIYLHDTPSRSSFRRSARAFSHGCIRVGRPLDLAEQLLTKVPGKWSRKKIDKVVARQKRTRVYLPDPLPVHLTYSTAFRGPGGGFNFRPDIYGRDKKLYRALFGKHSI